MLNCLQESLTVPFFEKGNSNSSFLLTGSQRKSCHLVGSLVSPGPFFCAHLLLVFFSHLFNSFKLSDLCASSHTRSSRVLSVGVVPCREWTQCLHIHGMFWHLLQTSRALSQYYQDLAVKWLCLVWLLDAL